MDNSLTDLIYTDNKLDMYEENLASLDFVKKNKQAIMDAIFAGYIKKQLPAYLQKNGEVEVSDDLRKQLFQLKDAMANVTAKYIHDSLIQAVNDESDDVKPIVDIGFLNNKYSFSGLDNVLVKFGVVANNKIPLTDNTYAVKVTDSEAMILQTGRLGYQSFDEKYVEYTSVAYSLRNNNEEPLAIVFVMGSEHPCLDHYLTKNNEQLSPECINAIDILMQKEKLVIGNFCPRKIRILEATIEAQREGKTLSPEQIKNIRGQEH